MAAINGSDNSETLEGTDSKDTLNGGAGDDTLYGEGGNDNLNGQAGDDILHGQEGDDSLAGGDGDDRLTGHEGDDTLTGSFPLQLRGRRGRGRQRALHRLADRQRHGGLRRRGRPAARRHRPGRLRQELQPVAGLPSDQVRPGRRAGLHHRTQPDHQRRALDLGRRRGRPGRPALGGRGLHLHHR
ncbi:hypothetical protein FCG41_02285 [Azotobacter chroococcum]|nr:hypothetical protein FCG41_02285 [Azotobacter chroococcum]